MSLKDRFDKFIDYFTEDGEDVGNAYQPKAEEPIVTPVPSVQELPQQAASTPSKDKNITRLHARQQELAMQSQRSTDKVTIDVRYPRKYEDATDIVDLLAGNESILIDFQYMTEVQARRCLDYLDGARHVLAGNMKKVASTMYLLTPVDVVVNIEDIKIPDESQNGEFGFDMKRTRRNRGTVDSNKGFIPSSAQLMDCTGDNFFTRAAFTNHHLSLIHISMACIRRSR